ncbi:MAG: TIGR04076 family protein [Anaerolineae bacterium]|nr:TIGR04076 family protein [Anaerolineae bacterium]
MDEPMFPSRNRVKITVLKKLFHEDLIKEYTDTGNWGPCSHFSEGQEFAVSEDRPWDMPPGFCGWAWADIQKAVWGMARGGPNVFVTCCTDGYRPVLFKLEKEKVKQ